MFCWTQNVLYEKKDTFLLFVFSRCCRGFVSSLLNRPHTSQSWRFSVQALNMLKCDRCGITSNHIGSNGTCYCNKKSLKKKLFTIFDLFCNVLIYFNRFYLTLFHCYCFFVFVFFFISKDAKIVVHQPLTSYELPSRQRRVRLWYVFDLRFSLCPCLHGDILH